MSHFFMRLARIFGTTCILRQKYDQRALKAFSEAFLGNFEAYSSANPGEILWSLSKRFSKGLGFFCGGCFLQKAA